MNRFTEKNSEGLYVVSGENGENAVQRLGAFEDMYESLVKDQERIPRDLEALRIQGKEKTATYKEMMAKKLINNNIVIFFERHGLK